MMWPWLTATMQEVQAPVPFLREEVKRCSDILQSAFVRKRQERSQVEGQPGQLPGQSEFQRKRPCFPSKTLPQSITVCSAMCVNPWFKWQHAPLKEKTKHTRTKPKETPPNN